MTTSSFRVAVAMICTATVFTPSVLWAQSIYPDWSGQLALTNIAPGFFTGQSRITQMVLVPGPAPESQYLYMSTERSGIRRAVYDATTHSLVDGSLETVVPEISGLGIAFDGTTLYATQPYRSDADNLVDLSRIWRIEDMGFGNRTEIVQGIPRQDHGVNNIQIVDHALYVGIGNRTRNGAFQTWNDDTYGESAYGGTIAVIDDLRQVGSEENAAGFYPGHPNAAQYEQLINGQNPIAPSPYTSTEPGKLRIHSSGTRNPFGIAADGDGQIWFTNNFQRTENDVYDRDNLANAEGDAFGDNGFQDDIYDQFFRAMPKADYGFRNGNWQNGNAAGNTAAVDAGFFAPENRAHSLTFDNYDDPAAAGDTDDQNPAYNQDYQLDDPAGLGPSSSSNGLAFYQANSFPLALHQDAFIARWNGRITDDVDELEYRDVVAVDTDTGQVRRIATGFRNPLDMIEDGQGGLIVADHGGTIYRISASEPAADAYAFTWDSDQPGNWSDRLTWNADSLPEADRMVPHEWGSARYAVTMDRPAADVTVTLDRSARIESLQLAERLVLADGQVLTVDQACQVLPGGMLAGGSAIEGQLINSGQVSPGSATGPLRATSYQQTSTGQLLIDWQNLPEALLEIENAATLDGDLLLQVDLAAIPPGSELAGDVLSAGEVVGDFARYLVNDQPAAPNGHLADGRFLRTLISENSVHVRIYAVQPGDANGDELFNSTDLIEVFAIGEYEDAVPGNSDWIDGDWDGNQDFDSGDIVLSMQIGSYVEFAHPVPEPSAWLLTLLGLTSVARRFRPGKKS